MDFSLTHVTLVLIVCCLLYEPAASKAACTEEPETGPCKAMNNRWYFEASSGQCKDFVYGGCGGNDNRYDTRAQCEAACKS